VNLSKKTPSQETIMGLR